MNSPVIIIGIGEMGGVFARGVLRAGHPVYPVTRQLPVARAHKDVPDPLAVIVAVGEKDLASVLKTTPDSWRDRLVLVQNELLPKDWQAHQIDDPTVISVWFEKKRPADYKEIIPSPVYGPRAGLIAEALASLGLRVKRLNNPDDLLFELILKNLYILTVNIAGLKVGGTVGALWEQHRDLARGVADDVLAIQLKLAGREFDRDKLMAGMLEAFDGDPEHKCMGRSAPARLARALTQAEELGVKVDVLKTIQKEISQ